MIYEFKDGTLIVCFLEDHYSFNRMGQKMKMYRKSADVTEEKDYLTMYEKSLVAMLPKEFLM